MQESSDALQNKAHTHQVSLSEGIGNRKEHQAGIC